MLSKQQIRQKIRIDVGKPVTPPSNELIGLTKTETLPEKFNVTDVYDNAVMTIEVDSKDEENKYTSGKQLPSDELNSPQANPGYMKDTIISFSSRALSQMQQKE